MTIAPNIYEQQARNKRATVLLITAYLVLFCLVGAGVDLAMSKRFGGGMPWTIFMIPVFIVMIGTAIISRVVKAKGGWISMVNNGDPFALILAALSLCGLVITISMFEFARDLYGIAHAYDPGVRNMSLIEYEQYIDKGMRVYFPLPIGTAIGLLLGATTALWGYFEGSQAIAKLVALKLADPEKVHEKQFINCITEMSIASGISPPSAYILSDQDPNAFSIGTRLNKYGIVATTGLLRKLNRDEVQAVVAHEISHIRNNDTRVMTLVSILFGSTLLLSSLARRGSLVGGVLKEEKLSILGNFFSVVTTVVWLLTILVTPIIAKLLAMAVSRNREYFADSSAVELTRNPEALASALDKLESDITPTKSVKDGLGHLCIVDPRGRPINNTEGFWANLFSTHPPMKKRLLSLGTTTTNAYRLQSQNTLPDSFSSKTTGRSTSLKSNSSKTDLLITCTTCAGSGECQTCHGTGTDCTSCRGSGWCSLCDGTGQITKQQAASTKHSKKALNDYLRPAQAKVVKVSALFCLILVVLVLLDIYVFPKNVRNEKIVRVEYVRSRRNIGSTVIYLQNKKLTTDPFARYGLRGGDTLTLHNTRIFGMTTTISADLKTHRVFGERFVSYSAIENLPFFLVGLLLSLLLIIVGKVVHKKTLAIAVALGLLTIYFIIF